ncbi:MAG: carbamoyl phosphate synthase small subunit [Kiritimatiellae bacterium]|nr:carbamoyl phosphate synthase small subunit [Kiritimatiellia bacterium]
MNYEEKWQAERERAAFLALDDGTVFRGVAFGARKDGPGEVVFNTGMTGYQEILTDPSYAGQFVALTTAEVGNYGVNDEDPESRGLFLSGLVVGDLAEPSNWRSTRSLDDYLKANGVPGIRAVDTRRLALHIREHGNRKAWLHVEDAPLAPSEAIQRAQAWEGLDGQDYAAKVTCDAPYDFTATSGAADAAAPLVAVYDFGVKANILRSLASFARVRVVPAKTSAEEVLALRPAGVFLSNGPADPAALPYAIENIRKILGISPLDVASHKSQVTGRVSGLETCDGAKRLGTCDLMTDGPRPPVMGICLGHQLLALACGAKTGRLAFGHHGCNHPVKELATGKVQITSQNHNFAVLADSLPPELEVTHLNLNDGTIEGLRHKTLPAFSVQYHPEACPGPHDAAPLFDRFRVLLASRAPAAR